MTAAKFGDSPFSASEIASAAAKDTLEQTVYAVFRRDQGRDFLTLGADPKNERVTLYKLKGYAWVFTYGINMNAKHLRAEFHRRGFDFDSIIVGAHIAELPGARLSWRNKSTNWSGGTATFEEDPTSDLAGIAYLVREPLGVQAFEAKEKPKSVAEPRNISIAGRLIPAIVFNVAPNKKLDDDLEPSEEYIKELVNGAREHGLAVEL